MRTGSTRAEIYTLEILDTRVNPQFKMVNENLAFKAGVRWEDVGNNKTRYVAVVNPTQDVEMYIIGITPWAFANTRVDYYLDPDITGGTPVGPVPYRLGSGAVSQMRVLKDPTVNSPGTHLLPDGIPGGERRFAQGGSNEGFVGFSLLPGHTLLIQMKNVGQNTGDMGVLVSWWEIKKGGWSP